ncbi:MAG: two-component regulator propeller domain-containing protein [Chitinophagaceae bacterium]
MKKIYLLPCLLLYTWLPAQAPQVSFTFEHISTQDGLAHRVVNDIMQDHKGYIWMATQNGLQRYDGKRFMSWHKVFGDPFSLPSDNVGKIFEDHANNIWVVCHNGVAILNTSNNQLHRIPLDSGSSYSDLSVFHFFEDSKHNIWMGTKEAGLLWFNAKKANFTRASAYLPPHRWRFKTIIEEPATGNYWLGSDSGIAYADMKQKKIFDYRNNPDEHPVLANPKFYLHPVANMFIDSYLKFWITTYISDGKGFSSHLEYDRYNLFLKKFETYIPLGSGHFRPYQDKAGNIWFAGDAPFQVWKPQTGLFYEVNKSNPFGLGFDANVAMTLCEDKEQNIWVGTDNGVFVFNPVSQQVRIKQFTDPATGKPADQYFNQFTELPGGKVWAATWGGGIVEYDQKLNQVQQYKNGIKSHDSNFDLVWALYRTKDSSQVWIGCQLGRLAMYDVKTKGFRYFLDTAFDQRTIRTVAEDSRGNLWFGTQHGLVVKLNKGTDKFIRYVDNDYPLTENLGNISRIIIDEHDRIWASTQYSGLVEIDPLTGKVKKAWRSDDNDLKTISGNICYDMMPYKDSLLVIATTMGINIFNKNTATFAHITTADGLLSNLIFSLQKDNNGFIWAGTGDGFYKIGWPSRKIVRFGKKDGIMNDGFQAGGLEQLADGRILSAADKDFEWFYPDSLESRKETPKVELTQVRLLNEEINIDSVLTDNTVLDLGYKENFITIEFSALSFLNRGRLTYYTQLEGLEKEWNKSNNYLISSYANLKPGLYTYRVYAENSEAAPGPVTSFKIRINPPWWNAWWFYCICGAVFISVFYMLYRVRVNKILAMEKVRNRIARDLHDDMGSTLSTINILSEMAKRKVQTDTQKTSEYIEKISDNSQRMMEAMDDIVWSINPINDNMQRIVARMREYATNILEAKDIAYQFKADESLNDIKIDPEKRRDLFLIFKEAVNNLAKYSKCDHAHIAIKMHRKNVVMLIEDDGVGFDTHIADSGNGLTNMKKRAELLSGRLEIKSSPGKGTRVIMEVPV